MGHAQSARRWVAMGPPLFSAPAGDWSRRSGRSARGLAANAGHAGDGPAIGVCGCGKALAMANRWARTPRIPGLEREGEKSPDIVLGNVGKINTKLCAHARIARRRRAPDTQCISQCKFAHPLFGTEKRRKKTRPPGGDSGLRPAGWGIGRPAMSRTVCPQSGKTASRSHRH